MGQTNYVWVTESNRAASPKDFWRSIVLTGSGCFKHFYCQKKQHTGWLNHVFIEEEEVNLLRGLEELTTRDGEPGRCSDRKLADLEQSLQSKLEQNRRGEGHSQLPSSSCALERQKVEQWLPGAWETEIKNSVMGTEFQITRWKCSGDWLSISEKVLNTTEPYA